MFSRKLKRKKEKELKKLKKRPLAIRTTESFPKPIYNENKLKKQAKKPKYVLDTKYEDKVIKSLGKKLHIDKRKTKKSALIIPNSFKLDGLDYLLEICDRNNSTNKEDGEDGFYKRPLNMRNVHHNQNSGNNIFESDDLMEEEDDNQDESDVSYFSENEVEETTTQSFKSKKHSKDPQSRNVVNNEKTGTRKKVKFLDVLNEPRDEYAKSNLRNKQLREDIYGRVIDDSGDVVGLDDDGRHTNANLSDAIGKDSTHHSPTDQGYSEGEELVDKTSSLYKGLKGIFNRLSEQTVHYCLEKIQTLYDGHSRNEVNSYALSIIQSTFLVEWKLSERMIAEHALIIAALTSHIGLEIGAFFLENLAVLFDQRYSTAMTPSDLESRDGSDLSPGRTGGEKHCLHNIVALLSHFLNFKVCDSVLIYDIIEELIDRLGSLDLELIITILKTCGPALRRCDPTSMKNVIQKIRDKTSSDVESRDPGPLRVGVGNGQDDGSVPSRVKFMIEILTALKNNNFKKIPGYEGDQLDSYLKVLRNLSKKGNKNTGGTSVHYDGARFNMRYRDLLASHVIGVGKWWIVGAPVSSAPPLPPSAVAPTHATTIGPTDPDSNPHLDKLAGKHGMNTQIRRTIFSTLVSSQDFLSAYNSLVGLGLKRNSLHEREIFNVTLHCCLLEKTYNPFYSHVATKFCMTHRDYRRLCEFSIWDKMTSVESLKDFQIDNLATFVYDLLIKGAIALFILKKFDFLDLGPRATRLVRRLLLLLLSPPTPSTDSTSNHVTDVSRDRDQSGRVDAIFLTIARSPKSRVIYESLRLFVRHFVFEENDVELDEKLTEDSKLRKRWREIEEITENI